MKHVIFHLPSFLRRVRIHGGEFDSSARAMNRVKQARLLQADPRIVRGSTIERKQMSTKTTIKRIALVSVAALGLGVMSVVPSKAASQADLLALSAATGTMLTGETSTALTVTSSFLSGIDQGDTISVTAFLTSAPAGNTAVPKLAIAETTTAKVDSAAKNASKREVGFVAGQTAYVTSSSADASFVSAKFNILLATDTLGKTAGVKVGTYGLLFAITVVSGGGTKTSTNQTATITVTAAPADDTVAVKATSILNAGETISATVDATSVTASRTTTGASTQAAAATIKITTLNKAGLAAGESFTATIAGPGILGSGTVPDNKVVSIADPTARVLVVKNGDVVQVFPDGASGVATVTIASMLGVVLATETVTFFGAPATITATAKKPVIGGTAAVAGVLSVVVKDSAGVNVSNLPVNSFSVISSDITKIATKYKAATTSAAYDALTGAYLVGVTPVAEGTANLTVTTNATAIDTLGISATAAVSVRVGGTTAKLDGLLVATDKTSYAPGEVMTITVTPLDAAGLVLADDTHTVFSSAGLVSTHSLTATVATQAPLTNAGVFTTLGVGTLKVYAPNIEGDMTLSWTRSTGYVTVANDSLTGSLTIAISSPGTAAATDAANEATDAANAATDAALAAAEAADAATSAAQEASDAVAALSESVTQLIAGLQSQIKALAKVVNKIAKQTKK